MALIVRPTTDLVSLYDNALRALIHVTRPIHRLDLSHNLLGDGGAATLVQGLTSLRGRYSSPEAGIWGLSEINLIHNELGDAGMDAVLGYVKKDVMMRRVYLQSNSITLSSNLDSILNSIASSRLSLLFLNSNAPTPSGIEQFFSRLDAPHLQILHLSRCNIGYPSAKPIAAFLASSRSRNLLELQLNANSLGYQGVKELVDTIASHNYTIELLGLAANDPAPARRRDSFGDAVEGSAANEGDEPEENVMPNEAALREAELDRLSTLLARNRGYTRRVQKAAARCIAPARILLNAKPAPEPSPLYIARQVISDVSQVAHAFFQPSSAPWLLEKPFPFLDLPPEIRYQIVRHTSMDPLALSDGQFARLRAEAEDREALRRLGDVMQTAIRREREDVRAAVRGVRDEWLRRNWWNKWDCEVAS